MAKPFSGYTDRQAAAIHRALPLTPDAESNWPQILETITECMQELSEENVDPDKCRYRGVAARRYMVLMEALGATLSAYKKLGEALQWSLMSQLSDIYPVQEQDSELLLTLRRLLSSDQFPRALNALQLAADMASKISDTSRNIQTTGRPKNYLMQSAVEQLLGAFEEFTGIPPKLYYSAHSNSGFGGNFYKFAVTCLAPVDLVPRKRLGSAILAAYRQR